MKTKLRSFIAFLNCSKKTLLLMMIVTIASVTVTTAISMLLSKNTNLTVPSLGNIKTIGVEAYWDQNRENKTETVDWNEIWFGTATNITLYLRSISNYEVILTLKATDWNPSNLSNYLTLSWDYNGQPVNPNEVIKVTITLSVSSSTSLINYLIDNDVKDFNFDIHILATI